MQANSNPKYDIKQFMGMGPLPNNKFDLNAADEVGANYAYPDGSESQRAAIEAEQKRYMQGWIYFLMTDPRMPADVQNGVKALGLCKDEFTDNGGWPHQIYVREARRMVGAYVLTEQDLNLQTSIPDSIGLGGYPADDHWHHIGVFHGGIIRECRNGGEPPQYPIPYRVLTPKADEATNLLVAVTVSASHWAFTSLRVELTYMVMGQAAGAAASLAIDENVAVQGVDAGVLQNLLVGDGVGISPDSLAP